MRQSVEVEQLHRGTNNRLRIQQGRVVVSAAALANEWEHPWTLGFEYVVEKIHDPKTGRTRIQGEWRATVVAPGFVNGHEVHVTMPVKEEAGGNPAGANLLTGEQLFSAFVFSQPPLVDAGTREVPLTDDPAPYLVLGDWRNPLAPGTLSSNAQGEIVTGAGEGYPSFFNGLGVKLPARGGKGAGADDPSRTREIRAMDLVLIQPRLGSALEVEVNPAGLVTGEAVVNYSTRVVNDYFIAHQGRARLEAQSRYAPLGDQSVEAVFGLRLAGGDPQFDALKLATVWIVSPPHASPDDVPDSSWEPYAQYFVFWNVAYAPGNFAGLPQDKPITLGVPLAGGAANPILQSFLSVFNAGFAEALAFLSQSSPIGTFWTQ